MSRQREYNQGEYDQRGYAQQANRSAYSNSDRRSMGQSYSRPLYDHQSDTSRNDQWRSEQRNEHWRDSSADRQRAYADRWADDWRAPANEQRNDEQNQQRYGYYGRDDYGNAYDELPDGGRGVYTHDHGPRDQHYGNDNLDARTREHDREFIEAVYGPHREKVMPRDYRADQRDRSYGRPPIGSSEGAPYMQHPAERQPGYGRSEIIDSNWTQTRGAWDHQNFGNQYDAERYQNNFQGNSYRGKGPKGYERSDERLKELICECLTDAPSIDASDITVDVKDHEVTLTGTVTSRAAKHLAEDLVEGVGGVSDINNQLKINANEQRGNPSSGQANIQGTHPQGSPSMRSTQSTATINAKNS